MKKTIFILCGIIILFVSTFSFLYYQYQVGVTQAKQNREEYERYTQNQIMGSSLMTVMNKASNDNEKNGVQKDNEGNYIANDTNSVQIDIKFLEADKVVSMEKIQSLGEDQFFFFYHSMSFQCTKKEYHESTKQIKYLLFEQV